MLGRDGSDGGGVSLVVDLAVLAEGAATDARGNVTLVAANPSMLIAEELPAQFSPVFLAVVNEGEDGYPPSILTPGRVIAVRIEVTSPEDEVLFVGQLRQAVAPPPYPDMQPILSVIAQVPFAASKVGRYTVSAQIRALGEGEHVLDEVTARRTVRISDRPSLTTNAAGLTKQAT
jgi:hypothetical protein